MTVCKKLWYGLQDDSLQGLDVVQLARHRYGRLQGNSLQDMGIDAISKNMVHGPNLYGMWMYGYTNT